MARKIAVDFFYDVISPYSWIGFEMLSRYQNQWKSMELKLKPFYLGGIMKGTQNKPPLVVPNKALYMTKDLKRLNQCYKIPIILPGNFVQLAMSKTVINPMRFITAIDMLTNGKSTENISRQLWKRIFNLHKDVTSKDSLREAGDEAQLDSDVINKAIEIMESSEVKDRLKQVTDEALNHGAFGAPTTVIHLLSGPEVIWGSDRIELIGSLLGEKYVGPLEQYSKL